MSWDERFDESLHCYLDRAMDPNLDLFMSISGDPSSRHVVYSSPSKAVSSKI